MVFILIIIELVNFCRIRLGYFYCINNKLYSYIQLSNIPLLMISVTLISVYTYYHIVETEYPYTRFLAKSNYAIYNT
jgi:hypothetical protein